MANSQRRTPMLTLQSALPLTTRFTSATPAAPHKGLLKATCSRLPSPRLDKEPRLCYARLLRTKPTTMVTSKNSRSAMTQLLRLARLPRTWLGGSSSASFARRGPLTHLLKGGLKCECRKLLYQSVFTNCGRFCHYAWRLVISSMDP